MWRKVLLIYYLRFIRNRRGRPISPHKFQKNISTLKLPTKTISVGWQRTISTRKSRPQSQNKLSLYFPLFIPIIINSKMTFFSSKHHMFWCAIVFSFLCFFLLYFKISTSSLDFIFCLVFCYLCHLKPKLSLTCFREFETSRFQILPLTLLFLFHWVSSELFPNPFSIHPAKSRRTCSASNNLRSHRQDFSPLLHSSCFLVLHHSLSLSSHNAHVPELWFITPIRKHYWLACSSTLRDTREVHWVTRRLPGRA